MSMSLMFSSRRRIELGALRPSPPTEHRDSHHHWGGNRLRIVKEGHFWMMKQKNSLCAPARRGFPRSSVQTFEANHRRWMVPAVE